MAAFKLEAWRGVEEAVRLENERQRSAGVPSARRYRSLHPASAQFIFQLALAAGAKRLVEVGTSAGYSTLWLARACAATGGSVVTLERNAEMVGVAESHFELAGVADMVEVVGGDARETLGAFAGPFDFAFVDGEKEEYVTYGELLWPKLAPRACLVADNVVSHAAEAAPFLEWLFAREDGATTVLEIGQGLAWAVKVGRGS